VTVNYPLLAFAILLLWFPRQWLRFGGFHNGSRRGKRLAEWSPRGQREPGDVSIWFGEEIRKGRNWVDLLRAVAGGLAVCQPDVAFNLPTKADSFMLLLAMALKTAILFCGLLVQILRFEGKATLFAPLFYLQGLAFGLLGWKAALFAIATVWVINTVLPSAAVFLFVMASLMLCFGMIYHVDNKELSLAVGLVMLPGLLSVIFKRRLAQFTKKTKIIDGSSSSSSAPAEPIP